MNTTKNLLTNLCNLLVCACEAFRYGLAFLRAILCSRAVLAAKLLAVESQLATCKHQIASKKHRRIRCRKCGKLFKVPKLDEVPKAIKVIKHAKSSAAVPQTDLMKSRRVNELLTLQFLFPTT